MQYILVSLRLWIMDNLSLDAKAMLGTMNLGTSDHTSVVSITLFVTLLCACIVIGHLLEENRWMNESITALIIVSMFFSCLHDICWWSSVIWSIYLVHYDCSLVKVIIAVFKWKGVATGVVILLVSNMKSSHLLVFNEELFFIYLLPPIIFNAG